MELILDEYMKRQAQEGTALPKDEAIAVVKDILNNVNFSDETLPDRVASLVVEALDTNDRTGLLLTGLNYVQVLQQLDDSNEISIVDFDMAAVRKYYENQIVASALAADETLDETSIRDEARQYVETPFENIAIGGAFTYAGMEQGGEPSESTSETQTPRYSVDTGIGLQTEVTDNLTGEVTQIYSDQDFKDLFAFGTEWQEPMETFLNAQRRGYFPTKAMRDAGVTQPLTMFQWETTDIMPDYGQNVPVGVMGLRNAVRDMPPEQVRVLVTKMNLAGIFEQLGGTPDRAFSGSDAWIQSGLNILMAESLTAGGIGLNEVLRRRTNARVTDVRRLINDANISTVQSTLRQIGVQFLGRPLTEEESLSVLSGLEQLAPEFAQAQLALGLSPQDIVADVETITEEEARAIGTTIEQKFAGQATRWRAGNRSRGLGEEFAAWKRGADQSVETDMPLSGLQSSVETVSDVLGDANATG